MEAGKDLDGIFVGKGVCIRGIFMVRTERYNASDAYAPGDAVSPAAGVLRANPVATTDYSQKVGEVIALNSTRGYLDVSVLS